MTRPEANPRFLRSRLRRRALRRTRRNLGQLLLITLLGACGFGLSLTFLIASGSTLAALDDFAESHHRQAGVFLGPGTEPKEGTEGIEEIPSADLAGPNDTTVRIHPPRTELNLHQVVDGRDLAGEEEVLLTRHYAEAQEIGIGDTIRIGGVDLDVVGYVALPDQLAVKPSELMLQPNPETFGLGIVDNVTFERTFDEFAYPMFAYSEVLDAAQIEERYEPAVLRQAEFDSAIQTAEGDAAGPRDIALLVYVLFVVIQSALLATYHLRHRTIDGPTLNTLELLGLSRGVQSSQLIESRIVIVVSWLIAAALALWWARPVMGINAELYDFPRMSVHGELAIGVAVAALLVSLLINEVLGRLVYRGSAKQRGGRAPSRRGIGLNKLTRRLGFGLGYRLVRDVRRPSEPAAVFLLLLVVTTFIAFAVNIKVSVDDWVKNLRPNTPYEVMYDFSALPAVPEPGDGQEEAQVASVYGEGIAQTLFSVPADSQFFGVLDGPAVTAAFADKYSLEVGDTVELEDVTGATVASLEISRIIDNTGSAFVYVPEDQRDDLISEDVTFGSVIFSDHLEDDWQDAVPNVTRTDVVTSGETITKVIDMQITMLVVLAALLLVVLLHVIAAFVMSVQAASLEVMSREGISRRSRRSALFGDYPLIALVGTLLGGILGAAVTRGLLDGIMGQFSHYVPVTATALSIGLALVGTVVLMSITITAVTRRRGRNGNG